MPSRFWKAGGNAFKPSRSFGFDTSYVPIAISAPVLTRTSAAGAAPLLFTTGLNNSNTNPFDDIRYQVATDSGFTAITQDIPHQYTEGEYEGLAIDITADGFATWSGQAYLRSRVERGDGLVSPWSNTITDTISAASMALATTTGQHKDASVTVTGTPALSFSSSGSFSVGTIRGSRSFTGTKVWEWTPGALAGGTECRFGLDSGAVSLNGSYRKPGEDNSDGAVLVIEGSGFYKITANNGTPGGASARTHVSTDKYMCEFDTVTGAVRFYVTPSGGSRTLLRSATIATGDKYPFFSVSTTGITPTVNFGQSAFAGVPTSGYTFP